MLKKMETIKGIYINLDSSNERRELIEANLKQNNLLENYKRFEAVKGDSEEAIRRGLSAGELGIWISWVKVLEQEIRNTNDDYEYLHIIEDDVIIGNKFIQLVNCLQNLPKDIDIIYTDMYVNPSVYNACKRILRESTEDGCIRLAYNTYSGCMASAIIHRDKIEHVYNTLIENMRSNKALIPIDNSIRSLMHEKKLKIGVTLPFLTTVNPRYIQESTIQETSNNELSINATQDFCTSLRQFMCVGAGNNKVEAITKCAAMLAQIRNKTTREDFEYELVELIIDQVAKHDLPRYKYRSNLQGQLDNQQSHNN